MAAFYNLRNGKLQAFDELPRQSTNYTITFVNGTPTVTPAPLTASGINIQATAGAPFSGTVVGRTEELVGGPLAPAVEAP